MNVVLKGLIAEGGPLPPTFMRDRRWQRAKLRYDIAKQRQMKNRSREQLREEREQAWNEAHQRAESQRLQAAATFQDPGDCPVCATMIAAYPTKVSGPQTMKDTAWWEQPGGLVVDHVLRPRLPLRPVRQARQKEKGTSVLRGMARNFRRAMTAAEAHKQIWESRYRTETAIRRKHGLGEEYRFEPEFWESPISALLTRQYRQQAEENARMAARRARGNTPRPRPPRSSLVYSERSDEIEIDEDHLEFVWRMEELEIQDRQARKVGEEVGYLYFVGEVDGLLEWSDDYLRSDRGLVYRQRIPEPEPEPESEEVMSMSDSEDSDSNDSGEDEDKDGDEDEEGYDEMDVDT